MATKRVKSDPPPSRPGWVRPVAIALLAVVIIAVLMVVFRAPSMEGGWATGTWDLRFVAEEVGRGRFSGPGIFVSGASVPMNVEATQSGRSVTIRFRSLGPIPSTATFYGRIETEDLIIGRFIAEADSVGIELIRVEPDRIRETLRAPSASGNRPQ